MKTILVIYEDSLTSKVIERTLQKNNYEIEKVQMSDLSLDQHSNPDLIIIELPKIIDMGIKLVKMIKETKSSIKILITSAHNQSDIDKAKQELGLNIEIIQAPWSKNDFLSLVKKMITKK